MSEKCLAGKLLGRHVPRRHGRIVLDAVVKGKRLPVCERCWGLIARSEVEW